MKVLFLVKSEKTPSSRIRVLDLVPYLRQNDIEAEVEILPESYLNRLLLFRKASSYPVTLLQKRLLSMFDFMELRRRAKSLVFDFDDAIYHKNASCSANPADYESFTRMMKFKRTVGGSDMVIAANKVLADKVKEINPKAVVEIIPSSVDLKASVLKINYSLSSPPIIGWIGTRSTLRYIEMVTPALREVRNRHPFVLRVVSDRKVSIEGLDFENIAWSLERQGAEIARFDIGIMPLSEDPFSRGKSAYKLLQYLAAGVPSVCSPVGMNAEVAGVDEYCLTAADNPSFASKIISLLDDCELRTKIGGKGRELVKRDFSIDVVASKLAQALKMVC